MRAALVLRLTYLSLALPTLLPAFRCATPPATAAWPPRCTPTPRRCAPRQRAVAGRRRCPFGTTCRRRGASPQARGWRGWMTDIADSRHGSAAAAPAPRNPCLVGPHFFDLIISFASPVCACLDVCRPRVRSRHLCLRRGRPVAAGRRPLRRHAGLGRAPRRRVLHRPDHWWVVFAGAGGSSSSEAVAEGHSSAGTQRQAAKNACLQACSAPWPQPLACGFGLPAPPNQSPTAHSPPLPAPPLVCCSPGHRWPVGAR